MPALERMKKKTEKMTCHRNRKHFKHLSRFCVCDECLWTCPPNQSAGILLPLFFLRETVSVSPISIQFFLPVQTATFPSVSSLRCRSLSCKKMASRVARHYSWPQTRSRIWRQTVTLIAFVPGLAWRFDPSKRTPFGESQAVRGREAREACTTMYHPPCFPW